MSILSHIYAAVDDDPTFAALPSLLAAELSARSVALQHLGPGLEFESATTCYFTQEIQDYYVRHAVHEDDRWARAIISNDLFDRATVLDDLVSAEDYRKSRYYAMVRHAGDDTGHSLGAPVRLDFGILTIGAHRAFGAGAFTAAEAARLDPLIPHLRRLYDLRLRLGRAQAAARLAADTLDALATALMLTDRAGRPALMNASARALLDARDGLVLARGRVATGRASPEDRLGVLIRRAAEGASGGAMLVARPSCKPAYRVIVAPWHAAGRRYGLVLIDDPAAANPSLTDVLTSLFGLTRAEATTVELLAEGLSPEEIADRRAVGIATVRTQIKQALQKTETNRMAQLVGLASRLPGVTSHR